MSHTAILLGNQSVSCLGSLVNWKNSPNFSAPDLSPWGFLDEVAPSASSGSSVASPPGAAVTPSVTANQEAALTEQPAPAIEATAPAPKPAPQPAVEPEPQTLTKSAEPVSVVAVSAEQEMETVNSTSDDSAADATTAEDQPISATKASEIANTNSDAPSTHPVSDPPSVDDSESHTLDAERSAPSSSTQPTSESSKDVTPVPVQEVEPIHITKPKAKEVAKTIDVEAKTTSESTHSQTKPELATKKPVDSPAETQNVKPARNKDASPPQTLDEERPEPTILPVAADAPVKTSSITAKDASNTSAIDNTVNRDTVTTSRAEELSVSHRSINRPTPVVTMPPVRTASIPSRAASPSIALPRPSNGNGSTDDYVHQLEQLVIELNYELGRTHSPADESQSEDWLIQRMIELNLQNLALKEQLRKTNLAQETA